MSQAPSNYIKTYNFAEIAAIPAGLPGSQIDAELGDVSASLNATISRLGEIQRDDGLLRNGVVNFAALGSDVKSALLLMGVNIRGNWAANIEYAVGDVVAVQAADDDTSDTYLTLGESEPYPSSTKTYLCVVAHSSSDSFANDYVSSVWGGIGGSGSSTGASSSTSNAATNSVSTLSIQAGAVNDSKISGVSGSKIAGLSIPAGKLAVGAVDTDDLANNAVTGVKLAVGSVGQSKLATAAVQTVNIQDGAVTGAKLADGAVTEAKIGGTNIPCQVIQKVMTGKQFIRQTWTWTTVTELSTTITRIKASSKVRIQASIACSTGDLNHGMAFQLFRSVSGVETQIGGGTTAAGTTTENSIIAVGGSNNSHGIQPVTFDFIDIGTVGLINSITYVVKAKLYTSAGGSINKGESTSNIWDPISTVTLTELT